jgi:hypothetical protein
VDAGELRAMAFDQEWRSVRRSLIEVHRRPGPARPVEGSVGWSLPGQSRRNPR